MLPFKRVLLIFTSFHRNNLYPLDLMMAWNLVAALVLFGLSIVLWVHEQTLSADDRFGRGALPSVGKIRHQHCFLRRPEHKTSHRFMMNDILLDALCGFGHWGTRRLIRCFKWPCWMSNQTTASACFCSHTASQCHQTACCCLLHTGVLSTRRFCGNAQWIYGWFLLCSHLKLPLSFANQQLRSWANHSSWSP